LPIKCPFSFLPCVLLLDTKKSLHSAHEGTAPFEWLVSARKDCVTVAGCARSVLVKMFWLKKKRRRRMRRRRRRKWKSSVHPARLAIAKKGFVIATTNAYIASAPRLQERESNRWGEEEF
jgi:hypothetical protein